MLVCRSRWSSLARDSLVVRPTADQTPVIRIYCLHHRERAALIQGPSSNLASSQDHLEMPSSHTASAHPPWTPMLAPSQFTSPRASKHGSWWCWRPPPASQPRRTHMSSATLRFVRLTDPVWSSHLPCPRQVIPNPHLSHEQGT
ncbi:uncharacterized protein B0I36DRAFT_86843 [Microdochium trichocladiopsis]|uniref:Uncharacterized protein n=1 Tax=Microdochium trichocladiopsis TaxID=1682393 RepID=A0A9P9BWF0_9PEZI|nr:uncharacterized protein B0I36DRAFT_86843 [Microdochium trichocladiopsis]KAH7035011.1 hypothetical protein B0I36DRAFT_86843 [Microdochium trichocladiopsis]